MPSIAFDPAQVAEFTLPRDAHLPEAERPRYRSRYLTCRQYLAGRKFVVDAIDAILSDKAEEGILLVNQAMGIGVIGWSGIIDRDGKEVPSLDYAAMDDAFTLTERAQIAAQCIEQVTHLEWQSKKVSPSPVSSAPEPSAPSAGQASA